MKILINSTVLKCGFIVIITLVIESCGNKKQEPKVINNINNYVQIATGQVSTYDENVNEITEL